MEEPGLTQMSMCGEVLTNILQKIQVLLLAAAAAAIVHAPASDAIVSVTFQMTPLTPTTPNTKPPSQPTASVRSSSAKDKSGRQRTCSAPLPPLESHGCRGATNSSGRHAYSSPIESGPHLRGELRELLGADFGYQVHYTRSRIMALQREQEYLTNLLNKLPITDTELMLNACDLPGDNDAADADAISLSHSIHSWNSSVASSSSSSPPTDNDRPYTTSQGPSRDSVYEAVLMDAPRVKAQQAYQDAIVALREADRELCYWLQQFLMITKENGCSLEYMLGMNDSIPSPALKIVRSNPEFTHNHPVSSSHAPTANAAVAAAAATTTARRRSHLRSFSVVEQQHQQQYDNVLQQQNQPSPTFSNCTLASSNDISRHSRNLEELCGSGTSATVTSTSINRPDPAKRLSNTGDDGSFGSRPDKVSAQPNERPYHGPVQLPPIEPHASILDAFATPFWGGDSPLSKQDEGSHGSGNASGQHHRRLDLTLTSPSPTSAAPPATTSSRKPTNPPYAFLSAPLPALQPSRPHASYPARDGSSSDVQTGASNANPPSPPPSPHRKQHARTTSLAVPSSVVQDKPKTPKGVSVQTNNDKTIPSTTTTGPLSSTPSLTPLPTPSVSANNNNNNSDKECRSREYDDVELLLYIGDHLESVSKAQRLVEKINQEMMVANHRYAQFRKAQQNYRRARRVPRHIRVEETF
ncbi:hypothetical protein BGW41_006710 [Actinomortierella wolfii]|nr:hypothetical protein BGW41_006710 [Actinomortierella wolfii]